MDGHLIITFIITVLASTLLSKKLDDLYKIPLPISLISISVTAGFFVEMDINFSILMGALLPLLLISDSLHLKLKDLKKNAFTLFYMAFVAVLLSIMIATYLMLSIYPQYYDTVFYIVLFSIIMATDAVSVNAVFKKFTTIPHKVSFLTEGESLFNDATAVIVFSLIAVPMVNHESLNMLNISIDAFRVLVVSIIIGLGTGYLASKLMSYFHETIDEFFVLPLTAYITFLLAEHFEVSGILAVVVSILLLKDYINKSLNNFIHISAYSRGEIKHRIITTKERLLENEKLIDYISYIAIAFLFVSLGMVVSTHELISNWEIIVVIFVISTIIRFTVFTPVLLIKDIKIKDITVMTLGGIKGGLAIMMVHMIPNTYIFKHNIETIVFGQVVLSTFVYVLLLLVLIPVFYRKR